MVQEFQVLRCFSCRVFQVHQVKKSKKWSCKLCREKQSMLKVYGQGSGADCRHHVQKLNLLQGQVEQAATDTDGQICQDAICDDNDEREQSCTVSQEEASMSRWNKYLEENQDGTCEEEEDLISTDQEHYFPHQDRISRTVRKRKHFSYRGDDFYKAEMKENISERKKVYRGGNIAKTSHFSCRITEDMGCINWHDKPVYHTLPLQNCSDAFPPVNKLEGCFEQSTCSTTSFPKREPKMDPIFNRFDQSEKIGPKCLVSSSQEIPPNDEPTATNTLSAQKISSPGLQKNALGSAHSQSDNMLKTSSFVSLQKTVIQYNIFQTDEDFDDNY